MHFTASFQMSLVFSLLLFTVWTVDAQNFRAAVVKKDITPHNSQHLLGYGTRMSTGVYDSIYHRITILDDGENEFILVSSDICLVAPSEYDRVSKMVQEKFNVGGDQFWWSVTHTHSAPEVGPPGLAEVFLGDRYEHQYDTAYTNFVVKELLAGIVEARSQLVSARLGVGWGYSQANINRRARNGKGGTRLGMNPEGPVDRRIGVLKIQNSDSGALMALIANYAIHGTVMSGHNLLISGDAPGVVAEYVEEKTGAPLLFINGAAGNIAPLYSVYPSPQAGHLDEFKHLLGDKILDANSNIIANRIDVKLNFGELVVKLPRKEGLGWLDDLKNFTAKNDFGGDDVLLPIRFLKIDRDIGIWAAPLELFCEISNEIRDRSPFGYTFYYGYTNGWLGYMLTQEEFGLGGYEPMVSPFAPESGRQLTESVVSYLKGELLSK
ncbi:neutral/alkaline non-lysosomal ceramidase N-terminal domain-containing protein [Membranihabitans marinus]|uniref:neutral/alkaline non-lysosomal ceramidase N-terminal domain-containing protein n=1 Tax=Membranihabitans marinus TaxID=1227546 RepID=UPI001F2A140D|nr:neutral/alkaline non-lysosomal ceramidase N-terminal domain-containing protein [Membranihabitans marinus]